MKEKIKKCKNCGSIVLTDVQEDVYKIFIKHKFNYNKVKKKEKMSEALIGYYKRIFLDAGLLKYHEKTGKLIPVK